MFIGTPSVCSTLHVRSLTHEGKSRCLCLCVCTFMYVCIRTKINIYRYKNIHIYTCTHTHIHVRIYTCTCTYIHIHTYIHTHIRVCVCVYVFTYMHAYTYIDTCIRTYIHTCMHAYIHACIHTYIHTHINTPHPFFGAHPQLRRGPRFLADHCRVPGTTCCCLLLQDLCKAVRGGGSEEGTCAMGCYEPRPVWTSRTPHYYPGLRLTVGQHLLGLIRAEGLL